MVVCEALVRPDGIAGGHRGAYIVGIYCYFHDFYMFIHVLGAQQSWQRLSETTQRFDTLSEMVCAMC